ncbi:biopolymer transporter ExbD [Leptospira selangorensis]|uniref:Biopolymer transporter ExbD n=1 Tax=Leptospira selangorensis TaxID=2484982 RepID=A0A5F2C2U7_9LEPT|nr:biopolymer transporter ExbD [Leptospira selangorensis]TGM13466.1 biopolymer transporter ExbD [Leptospira selangorensis]TGM22193.1 biopolymer transporter ExbD [Leptospira selangorensis]
MRKSILKEEDPGIDLTSFIDVVFILLVFVMLAVSFRKEIRSIPLELPKVGQGEDPKGERVEFALLQDGSYRIGEEKVQKAVLEEKLRQGLVKEKEVRFFADKTANYEEIVKLLDLLTRSGASSLELAVQGQK